MAYLVNQKLKLLGTGLEREPGQFVTDADFRTCPGLRDALLAEGAITHGETAAPAPVAVTQPVVAPVVVEQYDIPESPAEQRRGKKGAK